MIALAAQTVEEFSVAYVIGMAVCILLLLQWAWWQIMDTGEQARRDERRAAKLAKARRKRFMKDQRK